MYRHIGQHLDHRHYRVDGKKLTYISRHIFVFVIVVVDAAAAAAAAAVLAGGDGVVGGGGVAAAAVFNYKM